VRGYIVLRVGIIGCGKIADSHASQIQRIQGSQIVGVCDREILMARQLYERFSVKRYYDDVNDLLTDAEPDVVHITTPPTSHFDIAKRCLEHGCHVYVEKPFTLDVKEATSLLALAAQRGLKMTVGHDDQFSHVARRMRMLIESNYLGGAPVHMESYYGYDLGEAGYARALLGDKQHWVRMLPGGLLQNLISHGIARISELLTGDSARVLAHGFVSPRLRRMNEHALVDELRAMITTDDGTTAYLTFSSQMRPSIHQFRVFGPTNGLVLDQDHETLITLRGDRFKSYGEKFGAPVLLARQYLANVVGNGRRFLARDFHMKSGMKYLIELFYRSIVHGTPVPVPYREIVLTARIMDAIFDQLTLARSSDASSPIIPARRVSDSICQP
jgi:predicted dehydrogenase